MATRKKLTLPENFAEQLTTLPEEDLEAVFTTAEFQAHTRGGSKNTALHFRECPAGLTRWLVGQGVDVDLPNGYGETPLQTRAGRIWWDEHDRHSSDVASLLDLGAEVNGKGKHDAPLLHAVNGAILDHVVSLVEHGADLQVVDLYGHNALETAVWRCDPGNPHLEAALSIVEYLAGLTKRRPGLRGALGGTMPAFEVTDELRKVVRRWDHDWQLELARIRAKHGEQAAQAPRRQAAVVQRLRELFQVPAVAPVVVHDGVAPIAVRSSGWRKQHAELWDSLVPAGGPAQTVQGEAIRVSGRVAREILDNGAGNWDKEYRAMLDAFVEYIQQGISCDAATVAEARRCVAQLWDGRCLEEPVNRLEQIAVEWGIVSETRDDKVGKPGGRSVLSSVLSGEHAGLSAPTISGGGRWFSQARSQIMDRTLFVLIAAAVALMAGLAAHFNSTQFNPDIRPIMAVLRSNFWLTVHVIAIIVSYAAAMVAWGMAVVALGYTIFGRFIPVKLTDSV